MDTPLVSLVVPCYRLAHYLRECVESVLDQTYPNLEILILDDESPDDASAVAAAIASDHPGRRILCVRNATNLGHIRTYNKGIGLAAGKYVWILSPDDRLRSREIIRRYVTLLEARPNVGYVFCPGHRIQGKVDAGVHRRSVYSDRDRIIPGRHFVEAIVDNGFELLSPAVLMRRACYEEITHFPEDLPHRGDSYVWALVAMDYDVGYFAEAMVDYRIHATSMMSTMAREAPRQVVEDDIAVLWRIRSVAQRRGDREIVRHCEKAIIRMYAKALVGLRVRGETVGLPLADLETSLRGFLPDAKSRAIVRCRILGAYGDRLYWEGRQEEAAAVYRDAERVCPERFSRTRVSVLARLGLARSGPAGTAVRNVLGRARRVAGSLGKA